VILEFLVGGLTLGLPAWFAYLDRGSFPRLKWIGEGDPPPPWGRMVVVVGVGLAVLIALAAPLSGFDPVH
jgi:hypothetical protein